jgi:4-hydroxy-4-methyl-2-oxoglutarate aldolase
MEQSDNELLGLIPKERIVIRDIPRPDPQIVQAFLDLPDMAGLVARAMDRYGVQGSIPAHELSPLTPGKRVVGPAITVRNVPSRFVPLYGWQEGKDTQLGEREAYYLAESGDVIVIDSGGRKLCSNLGPNSSAMARSRGILGAIVDGPVTGVAGIRANDFPVWCRGGTTLTGHHRVDTIEINGIVACGNLQVRPGDLVVADDSGITIVPAEQIKFILQAAQALAVKGRALAQAVESGSEPNEVRKTFRKLIVDDQTAG